MLLLALLMVSCKDELVNEFPESAETQTHTGELVLFSSGTTENSASTRANTYYMEKDSRFVCQMYYKTDASGLRYDTDHIQTAWLKVEDWNAQGGTAIPGNSLYWNKSYSTENIRTDKFLNDEKATIFYWQNRKAHAFLAWTDLNHIKSFDESNLNFAFNSNDAYSYKTGNKVDDWVENGYYVWGSSTRYNDFSSIYNNVVKPDYLGTTHTLFTQESQAIQVAKKDEVLNSNFYSTYRYDDQTGMGYYAKEYIGTVSESENLRTNWYIICFFGENNRKQFSMPNDNVVERDDHYVYNSSNEKVAKVVGEGDNKSYFECDAHGRILYNEENPMGWVCIYCTESKEIIDEVITVDAKKYDLRQQSYQSMNAQPDILMAYEPEKVPTSAIMEDNRVHLYFKHQFAQVQVNLKNSEDESVSINADQIEKLELLGVSDYVYVFPYIYYDDSDEAKVRPPKYKDVVATDYTDEQLAANPYGSSFELYNRNLSSDESDIYGYIKSGEGITFGLLQAIRITWKETDAEGGVTHVATYRVPEKNEINQNLRLLESGVKYIWNMELRRGTLAVIRTEIIPWEVNSESYVVDGSIVTTPATSPNTGNE